MVKHILDGQDVGDLKPNDPLWIITYRQIHADDGATVGMLAGLLCPVFQPALTFGLNQPMRGIVNHATLQADQCKRLWLARPGQNLIKESVVQAVDIHVVRRATVC